MVSQQVADERILDDEAQPAVALVDLRLLGQRLSSVASVSFRSSGRESSRVRASSTRLRPRARVTVSSSASRATERLPSRSCRS